MYDVVIIGGGVIGCSIARELSAYQLKICVIEKEEDICSGTSKANSGIVHAGFDAKPGSLKAKMNVLGSQKMPKLAEDLDVPYDNNGSIVLCFDEKDKGRLEELKSNGIKNGVKGIEIIEGKKMKEMEPHISNQVVAFLYIPTGAIVCPFKLTIALAENAYENGVKFLLNHQVVNIEKQKNAFSVMTNHGELQSKIIVNAAGVYGDTIHNMVCPDKVEIIQRKGEYCLLDSKVGDFAKHTIFQLPTKYGKGVLVTPTIHGNLLIGPTAYDIEDKEGIHTTREGLNQVLDKALLSADSLPVQQIITSYAGLRAHMEKDDFTISEHDQIEGFFDVIGIESPGLSSAPAIGEEVCAQIVSKYGGEKKKTFKSTRKDIESIIGLPVEEANRKIKERPEYGNIICRCEKVTEGEIIDAIHRPLGATSLDGIKRRTRGGTGRCQSGFCEPKIVEILARERKISPLEVKKNSGESVVLKGKNKDV